MPVPVAVALMEVPVSESYRGDARSTRESRLEGRGSTLRASPPPDHPIPRSLRCPSRPTHRPPSSPNTPTPAASSPRRGSSRDWAPPDSSSSSPTRTCCSTRPGHIPGAVKVDWHTELNDPVVRDYRGRRWLRRTAQSQGHLARRHRRHLRRQEQLVGRIRAVGLLAVRPRGCAAARRRPRPVDRGGPPDHDRSRRAGGHRLPRGRARRQRSARVQGRRARAPRQAADRRALARGVRRLAHLGARLPRGGRAARGTHPDRAERALGASGGAAMAGSRPAPSSMRSTAARPGCRTATSSSRTAVSASGPATPGSCSSTCSASRTCATTTDRGPSGAARCACRSSTGAEPGAVLCALTAGRPRAPWDDGRDDRFHPPRRPSPRSGTSSWSCPSPIGCSCCWSSRASCRRFRRATTGHPELCERVAECQSPVYIVMDVDADGIVSMHAMAPPRRRPRAASRASWCRASRASPSTRCWPFPPISRRASDSPAPCRRCGSRE